MLLQFRFKNFKSFRDDAVLDFTAVCNNDTDQLVSIGEEKILRAAGIFGANASGKSNVIKAFRYMSDYVANSLNYSQDKGSKKLTPFLFDNKSKDTESLFEVYFSINSAKGVTLYNYGFCVTQNGVSEEWLNYKTSSKKNYTCYFYRSEKEIDLSGIPKKQQENVKVSLEKETLILSLGALLKINRLKLVSKWFMDNRVTNFGDPAESEFLSHKVPKGFVDNVTIRNNVVKYLAAFDPSILGFEVKVIKNFDDGKRIVDIKTKHKNMDGGFAVLPLRQESDGTLKMLALYQMIMDTLSKGSVLVIDELNSRLHPLLERSILLLFLDSELNSNHAQIVFTSHDLWQMANQILRRDEIWLTEKDANGVSSLYSLADFKGIKDDNDFLENYMLGKYGAIPHLAPLTRVEGRKYGKE